MFSGKKRENPICLKENFMFIIGCIINNTFSFKVLCALYHVKVINMMHNSQYFKGNDTHIHHKQYNYFYNALFKIISACLP